MHSSCGRYSSRLKPKVRCESWMRATMAAAHDPKAHPAQGVSASTSGFRV